MSAPPRRRATILALLLLAPPLLLALAADGISRLVTGFGYAEIQAGQALAPPGSRSVPEAGRGWDGDASSFDALDTDRDGLLRFVPEPDGSLRSPEVDAARDRFRRCAMALAATRRTGAAVVEAAPEGCGPGPRPTPEELVEATRWMRHSSTELLEADRDGDGAISRAEYPGAPRARPMLLGADTSGRDLATRVAYGARASLLVALLATLVSLALGTLVGITAGLAGGWVDAVLMRLADLLHGLPLLFLVMVLCMATRSLVLSRPDLTIEQASLLQAGVLFLALGACQWPSVARLARGRTAALTATGFVTAARAMGLPGPVTAWRHVLPHLGPSLLSYGVLLVPGLMLEEAFLSFLGFGLQPPYPSFGLLIQEGLPVADRAPLLVVVPLAALTGATVGAHLLARSLEARHGS
ncbi:MAG: ABC transporter permease [Deltaproteobacteria bacterium]|nr:ABC transporter permease [Deltaproteobacteria bacterium]